MRPVRTTVVVARTGPVDHPDYHLRELGAPCEGNSHDLDRNDACVRYATVPTLRNARPFPGSGEAREAAVASVAGAGR